MQLAKINLKMKEKKIHSMKEMKKQKQKKKNSRKKIKDFVKDDEKENISIANNFNLLGYVLDVFKKLSPSYEKCVENTEKKMKMMKNKQKKRKKK